MLPIKIHKKLNNCRFIVVAFYTVNTGYEKEVQNLLASMQGLDLSYEVWGIESLGSWQKNTQIKADFIKMMILKYKQPIAYIDADAVFHQYPELFDVISADFAAHYHNYKKELLSGTLFFNYTKMSLVLIDEWLKQNEKNPNKWDQYTLQYTHKNMSNLKFYQLPPEYTKIFDANYKKIGVSIGKPIIEHFQASRRFKE
jgi:hypothetical protein